MRRRTLYQSASLLTQIRLRIIDSVAITLVLVFIVQRYINQRQAEV